jgi:hypothetical protein
MDRNSLRQVREAKMLSKTGQTRRNLSVDAGPDWMIRVLDYADKWVVYGRREAGVSLPRLATRLLAAR